MNLKLRETIVEHVLANLAVIPSTFVSFDKSKSLKSKEFLLSDKISFIAIDEKVVENKLWGCQFSADQQDLKILLADCSTDYDTPEYAAVIHLKSQPMYGIYTLFDPDINQEALIAVSLNGKDWLECSTYLQATFLAGMENIKELGFPWVKCSDYKEELAALLSFIKFHSNVYGNSNEG